MPQNLFGYLRGGPGGDVSVFFEPDRTLVELGGDIDLALAESLDDVTQVTTSRGCPVQVDVSRVRLIDSTGLNLIVELAAAELKAGRRLRLKGVSPRLAELLRISGVEDLLI